MNEKIGVVVPVYKTEKYVAECIESILAQTYTNFRLILVDDGSPDRAGAICDEYAAKDSRITVVHQENAGVTRARARGVNEAVDCEWITFVDSDDTLTPCALEALHEEAAGNDTDIVISNRYYYKEDIKDLAVWAKKESEDLTSYRKLMMTINCGMPWNRLIRRRIVTPFCFELGREIFYGEDAIMNLRISFNTTKRIKILNRPIYNYRVHNKSVCYNLRLPKGYSEELTAYIFDSIPDEKQHLALKCWYWEHLYNNFIFIPAKSVKIQKELTATLKRYDFEAESPNKRLLTEGRPIKRFIIIVTRKIKNILAQIIGKQ